MHRLKMRTGLQQMASSIGCGLTFSPIAVTIVSFARPVMTSCPAARWPAGIRLPRSPTPHVRVGLSDNSMLLSDNLAILADSQNTPA